MAALPAESSATDRILRVDGLSKYYGEVSAVAGVSLVLEPGTFFALLGPSGCGKTTLLKMLAGFEAPTEGRIYLGERDITDVPPFRRPLNTVFQNYALFPHMDVAKNVGYALRQERPRRPKDDIAAKVNQVLRLVQLDHLSARRPFEISGGQQQRVALARALVAQPFVLLLDEPLSALDAKLRVDMQSELKALQERLGISFVFVTHDQSEALSMADRIAVMRGGQIVQDSTPQHLYDRPVDSWVAGFIGSMNFVAATVTACVDGRTHVRSGMQTFVGLSTVSQLPVGADVQFALRPERIRLAAHDEGALPVTGPTMPGRIEHFSFHGDQIHYTVHTDTMGRLKVTVPVLGQVSHLQAREGVEVQVGWDEDDARVVPTWSASSTA
jgi:spermidine/putrescine ABC transporter ATP-binding subunit